MINNPSRAPTPIPSNNPSASSKSPITVNFSKIPISQTSFFCLCECELENPMGIKVVLPGLKQALVPLASPKTAHTQNIVDITTWEKSKKVLQAQISRDLIIVAITLTVIAVTTLCAIGATAGAALFLGPLAVALIFTASLYSLGVLLVCGTVLIYDSPYRLYTLKNIIDAAQKQLHSTTH